MTQTKEKEEVVNKDTTSPLDDNKGTSPTPKGEVTPKKKSKTLWYIIGGIVFLLILVSVIGFFVVRGLIKKGAGTLEESLDQYEQVIEDEDSEVEESDEGEEDDESWLYKKPTEEGVEGELEKANLVNKNFPEDIPLSGGIVTASSYDSDYSVDVQIDINSTVEEILDWYEEAFEENDWVITERSSSEDVEGWFSGKLSAETEDGERSMRVSLDRNPYQEFTSVTVTEYFY
jgi:hypothetical protein